MVMDTKGIFIFDDMEIDEMPVKEWDKAVPIGAIRQGYPTARGTFYYADGDSVQLTIALTKEQVAILDGLIASIKETAVEKYGR
jgi:hypothetical protein